MLRLLAAIAVLYGLVVAPAFAETYADPGGRFSVMVPKGWTATQRPMSMIDVGLMSPRVKETNGKCPVMVIEDPASLGISQEDINEALAHTDAAFWTRVLLTWGAPDPQIEAVGSEMKGKRRVGTALARFPMKTREGMRDGRVKLALHIVPGRMLSLACGAYVTGFAAEERDFAVIFDSFAVGGDVVAQNDAQPRSTLMLFGGARFDGASQALNTDAPNLAQLGWRSEVGSLRIGGTGLWQVCDGVSYTGRCFVASLPLAGSIGDRPLTVVSARRYTGPLTPELRLGLFGAGASEHVRATAAFFAR